ncbi:UNVERIFIED_CONTAM: hypothetical protein FKN15_010801 [Acipenser sinensis]
MLPDLSFFLPRLQKHKDQQALDYISRPTLHMVGTQGTTVNMIIVYFYNSG